MCSISEALVMLKPLSTIARKKRSCSSRMMILQTMLMRESGGTAFLFKRKPREARDLRKSLTRFIEPPGIEELFANPLVEPALRLVFRRQIGQSVVRRPQGRLRQAGEYGT